MSDILLKEGKYYRIVVGVSSHKDHKDQKCYQVVNKTTEVVELESTLMPNVYRYFEDLEKEVDELLSTDEDSEDGITSSIFTLTEH